MYVRTKYSFGKADYVYSNYTSTYPSIFPYFNAVKLYFGLTIDTVASNVSPFMLMQPASMDFDYYIYWLLNFTAMPS